MVSLDVSSKMTPFPGKPKQRKSRLQSTILLDDATVSENMQRCSCNKTSFLHNRWVCLVTEIQYLVVFGVCRASARHTAGSSCVRVYVCTCVRVYVCTCVRVYVCTCVRVHMCVCV
jgi:hypothetical protein